MTRECDAAQVKLYGKFWGTRQWAFDAVSKYLMDKIPGVRVVIEDESQLKVGAWREHWKEGQTRFYTKCKQAVTGCISP